MTKCKKCGAKLTEDDLFCPECGAKTRHEKKQEKSKEKVKHEHDVAEFKLSKKKIMILSVIIGLLVIASVIIFAVPFPYQATQQYSENVPYDAQESYTEKEPHNNQECSDREAKYTIAKLGREDPTYGSVTYVEICNLESQLIYISYRICRSGECAQSRVNEIIMYPHSCNEGNGFVVAKAEDVELKSILVKPVQECKTTISYTDVTKYRTVTKYRNDYKERKTTKYSTLFNRWSGNIKWYYVVGEE